jgi:hypothetical protein
VAAVCQDQPFAELLRRFIRRLTVKGHERRGHAGYPSDLRAPAVADERHFDFIPAAAYGFFEVVNHGDLSE